MLQCVAVCCSVLQCVAACCNKRLYIHRTCYIFVQVVFLFFLDFHNDLISLSQSSTLEDACSIHFRDHVVYERVCANVCTNVCVRIYVRILLGIHVFLIVAHCNTL